MNSNPYKAYILSKGRDLPAARIAKHGEVMNREVPKAFQDRYSSWEQYEEALSDFLNGM
jgi:hypothetical protein